MADYQSSLTGQQMDSALTDLNNHTTLYGAEAWARGTKGGVDVGSTDPTFHNNARYYAEVAQSAVPSENGAVLWNQSQNLSASEKSQARANIHAIKPNEAVVNLLHPTLATTTLNGVTCTNNGDGTYTLNGTASGNATFTIYQTAASNAFNNCKLVGCPIGGGNSTYAMFTYEASSGYAAFDYGDGCTILRQSATSTINVNIRVYSGQTVSNLVFKPMITTNLSATYDDFVEYGHYTQFGELLWTNASPTSDFGTQAVSLDLSNYQFVLVRSYLHKSDSSYHTTAITRIDSKYVSSLGMINSTICGRNFRAVSSGLVFERGFYMTAINASSANDAYAIPYQIYGIR